MKKLFFTSDWHLYHDKSIELDKRPFRSLKHMHEVLINNYNSTVPKDGICYFLGDIGFCNQKEAVEIISQLHGIKVFIVGNHDKGHNSLYNMGFDLVLNNACIYLGNNRITMSHCPKMGVWREDVTGMKGAKEGENWHGESKHQRFSVADEGQFHLHGHIHSPNGGKSTKILDKQMDVGVPANSYRPVSIDAIASWIMLYNQGRKI